MKCVYRGRRKTCSLRDRPAGPARDQRDQQNQQNSAEILPRNTRKRLRRFRPFRPAEFTGTIEIPTGIRGGCGLVEGYHHPSNSRNDDTPRPKEAAAPSMGLKGCGSLDGAKGLRLSRPL